MAESTVRVLDLDTGIITTIPARELAPGMVKAEVQGIVGEVWVDASKGRESPIRHPRFPDAYRDVFRELARVFGDVYRQTVEQWEEGFRREQHPEQEIALLLYLADVFTHFTAGRNLDAHQRKDIYDVVLACVNNGPEQLRFVTSPRTLSRKRVLEIVGFFQQHALEGMRRANARAGALLFTREGATVTRPLSALVAGNAPRLTGDARPLLAAAEVVLGVEVPTGGEFLVYGRQALQEVSQSGEVGVLRVLRVELALEGDNLERLVGMVIATKGRHDFQPGGDAPDAGLADGA
jgi:hypothetical protein